MRYLTLSEPFVDGNKRTAHAVMEIFLVLNGYEIKASVDEQEKVLLQVTSGELGRDGFTEWLRDHTVEKSS
jgi:death-on-curing protein